MADSGGKTLELIATALAQRYGQPHAEKWLAEQLAKKDENLPEIRPAAEFASLTQKGDALRSPRRPLEPLLRDKVPADLPPPTPLEPIRRDTPFGAHSLAVSAPPPPPLSAGELSDRLTEPAEGFLSRTAYRIYRTLHEVALIVARARGYSPAVSLVTFHCPAEIIADALGIHRTTLWRNLPELEKHGLIDARAHKTTLRGQTVNDGTLWKIKLHPSRGKSARLNYEELKHQWRDLEADVLSGRTAYKALQQSNTQERSKSAVELILPWTLPPQGQKTPLSLTVAPTQRHDLETVLDVPYAEKNERNGMVDTAARAICSALGDSSVDFYRKLLWNLLRRRDQGQDYFQVVYTMMVRARVDYQEGFARNAGALLVSRLKAWEVWEELQRTPLYRVGTRPLQA